VFLLLVQTWKRRIPVRGSGAGGCVEVV